MIPYTSALPNKENLAMLDKYCDDWRFLLSPASMPSVNNNNRHLLYDRGYALDNGVYADWAKGQEWNQDKFISMLNTYAESADWIVIPDAVGDWWETARMFMIWYQPLLEYKRPLLYVAQDGIQQNDYATVRGMTERGVGIFVGGQNDFKLTHSQNIARICKENNATCHIGRINSAKRVRMCWNWGATSFDGSGMSRFRETARVVSEQLAMLRKQKQYQPTLF